MFSARGQVGMRGEAARGHAGMGTWGQGIPTRASARARAGARNARGNKVGAAPRAALATPYHSRVAGEIPNSKGRQVTGDKVGARRRRDRRA